MLRDFNGSALAPSLLYVNVKWCGYCKRARPMMEKVSQMLGTAVPVISVDGDLHEEYVKNTLGVNGYPTLIYVDQSGRTYRFEGERTVENIIGFVCEKSSKGSFGFCTA